MSNTSSSRWVVRWRLARRSLWTIGAGALLCACSHPNIAGVTGGNSGTPTNGHIAPSGYTVGTNSGQSASQFASIVAQVAAGLKVQSVPSDLRPSLVKSTKDFTAPGQLLNCNVTGVGAFSRHCEFPDTPGRPIIVIFGDSHAIMWTTPLVAAAQRYGYDLVLVAKFACPPPMITFSLNTAAAPNQVCNTWRSRAIARINALRPRIVIVTGADFHPIGGNGQPISQAAYSAGLVKTLDALQSPHRRVVLLGDIPYLAEAGPECLAAHLSSVQSCSESTASAAPVQTDEAQLDAARKAGATYVNVVPWLCTRAACPAIIDHIEVFADRFHITAVFADHLLPVLAAAIGLTRQSR
jgi:hypothetical protein